MDKKGVNMSYKSVWDFGRAGTTNYSVHKIGEYPTKIRPIVVSEVVKRFSKKGDLVLDPFCGCGTFAVEFKIHGRNSINFDINPKGIDLTQEKLDKLNKQEIIKIHKFFLKQLVKELKNKETKDLRKVQIKKEIKKIKTIIEELESNGNSDFFRTTHIAEVKDSRDLLKEPYPIQDEAIDSIITDIPYASMIKYSDLKDDLSNLENYDEFLAELTKSFKEIWRVLKKDKYCVIFVADYRIGASRKILPVHTDVINIMRDIGFTLFDTYIWRYYRSGGFRPFGKQPFQAMNVHSYILVFHKPDGKELNKPNRPIRYRERLIEKINNNKI